MRQRVLIRDHHAGTSVAPRGLLAVMCACVVLVVGMVAAINLAVPMPAPSALHPSAPALVWIVDTYVIVFACLLIPGGAAGDRFGRKGVLLAGLALFAAGALRTRHKSRTRRKSRTRPKPRTCPKSRTHPKPRIHPTENDMHVFITGATGWIGSAVVDDLLEAGHEVTGLARSEASAAALEKKGARAHRGDLDDLGSIAAGAEGVVHLANKHDWADPVASDKAERGAVETMLDALAGSGRPFLVANGLSGLVQGRPATEEDASPAVGPASDRGGSENLTLDYAGRDVRSMAVRFAPSVHGAGDWGFVTFLVAAAKERGVSGYVGDGSAAWSAVHRADAARLVRLGLEAAPAGSRLHAVAEEAVPTRDIAEAIGHTLGLPVQPVAPEDAAEHFGFVGGFFGLDMSASSACTRELLGWAPSGPTLLEDIRSGAYGEARAD